MNRELPPYSFVLMESLFSKKLIVYSDTDNSIKVTENLGESLVLYGGDESDTFSKDLNTYLYYV